MGGANSCWVGHKGYPSRILKSQSSTPIKSKRSKKNFSAAFNLIDENSFAHTTQIDINSANEEELMTLTGITRPIAHNIIEYRSLNGPFKKPEDLALVSGIGADNFISIKPEICALKVPSSECSSYSSWRHEISSQGSVSKSSACSRSLISSSFSIKININSSSVFNLMKVSYITQEIAQNIVKFREKNGLFTDLNDLLKVKGMHAQLLSAIRPHLTVEINGESNNFSKARMRNGLNKSAYSSMKSKHNSFNSTLLSIYPVQVTGSQDDLLSLYGPILQRSHRSRRTVAVCADDNLVRVASWNLDCSDDTKSENPGVKEVIALSILENGWRLLAVQNVNSTSTLRNICDELNYPTLPNVKKWIGKKGVWNYTDLYYGDISMNGKSTKTVGYLYDSTFLEVSSYKVSNFNEEDDLKNNPSISNIVSQFQIGHEKITIINFHLSSSMDSDRLKQLVDLADIVIDDAENVIILGDVGHQNPLEVREIFVNKNFYCLECLKSASTLFINESELSTQLITVHKSTEFKIGSYGVLRDGLTNPWIPDRWKWGGPVSKFAPLWVEFVLNKRNSSYVPS